ncbi:MAG TPA: glycosyltransferase [Segetibacter sp.]|jgi:glycosyltransferase involved in cell wall biosynthesis
MASGNHKEIGTLNSPFSDYVLALPGWYPTWLDPLPGDFNQRHIKAASLFKPQVVLYIGKDASGTLLKTEVRANQLSERITEIIVLYPISKMRWWDVIQSNIYFLIYLFRYARIIRQKFGKPTLLHSYIVMRGGLAGWLLSRRWKIPFVLSENWTIYYPADPGYLSRRNLIFQSLVKGIFRKVKRFLPVTYDLKNQSESLVGIVPSSVIPNVVETDIFNYQESLGNSIFRFIHVSTMTYQKNPEGLLRCFKIFNDEHPATSLQMVGPYPTEVAQYAASLGLSDKVEFTGAVTYSTVAELLKKANALVLFSRYENLPCVILEAFCCGLPVISTRVGGVAEVINDENGVLVDNENEQQLLDAFGKIYNNYTTGYDRQNISKSAIEKFSYKAVGKMINDVYEDVLA